MLDVASPDGAVPTRPTSAPDKASKKKPGLSKSEPAPTHPIGVDSSGSSPGRPKKAVSHKMEKMLGESKATVRFPPVVDHFLTVFP